MLECIPPTIARRYRADAQYTNRIFKTIHQFKLFFGHKARTPSSVPPTDPLQNFGDYLDELTGNLSQLQTLAAMNLVQAKYRSKYYYDWKLNVKHFREREMVYLLKEPKKGKFDKEFEGPYENTEINYKTHNVEIERAGRIKVVHINKIKRASTIKTLTEANK